MRLSPSVLQGVLVWPRLLKQLLVMVLDVALCLFTVWLSLSLRLEIWYPLNSVFWRTSALSVLLLLPLLALAGTYRAIFRYTGWNALMSLGKVWLVYAAVFVSLVTVAKLVPGVPRSVGVAQPVTLLLFMVIARLFARVLLDSTYRASRKARHGVPRVLVYGAGSAGRQIAAAMARSSQQLVVGYLDDDARLHGHTLDNLRVFNPAQLDRVLAKTQADEVLLALPSASRQRKNEILNALQSYPVLVRTLPALADLASGRVTLSDVRELDIEDLLGRDPVPPYGLLLNRNTHGKVVLITGAGGSIGSEIARQVLACQPKALLLLDVSEYALYQIEQELLPKAPCPVIALLGSVQDAARIRSVLHTWRPQTVYHAAAYKHVPMVEHNPLQGVLNNVWGTWVVAQECMVAQVQEMVLISTDKAVRPTNIMGASKRLAELVLQSLHAAHPQSATTLCMVRFGNVLGSSGSVVPLFRQQIQQGGPVTLTHADITRYFMTISEAAQLVIQAGAMASGGDVFVLDMGEPVRIQDLARRMVELSGLTVRDSQHPHGDIEIVTTGLRPGEKLYEELLIGDNPTPTQHPRILKAHEEFLPWSALQPLLQRIEQAAQHHDVPTLKALLAQCVSGYQPAEGVVDHVWVHEQQRTA
ncbi:polysaccharide biosynthesis protein [Macromonas nakdongensis]|uniref:polysaccharide biosynthesis protein n=1 Tax=Macromonas nakdongensis TaxID=1843082 RepID=UPI000C31FD12|nr:nucleoside-diphosphate sugar epimerase/dehydratase [Macromonas nakdongensis]